MMKVTNRILCREGGLRRAEDRFGRAILCDDERIDNGTETCRPDFQVQNAGPKTKDIVKLCRSCRADVLLLEVCPHPPRTLQDRLLLANDLRDVCPHCKTVLLVDEAEYPELATAVCLAKKDHIVDDFVYASVSPAYLSAMMDTL